MYLPYVFQALWTHPCSFLEPAPCQLSNGVCHFAPIRIFGISSLLAIEPHMPCLLTMKWSWSKLYWDNTGRSRSEITCQRPCQSPLDISGISSMPAIERHMSCFLTWSEVPTNRTLWPLAEEIREWDNASTTVSVVLVHFGNQLNASYQTTYVMSFGHGATFRRTVLCDLTQNRSGNEIMRQRSCQSSLYILGISSRPAIERHVWYIWA